MDVTLTYVKRRGAKTHLPKAVERLHKRQADRPVNLSPRVQRNLRNEATARAQSAVKAKASGMSAVISVICISVLFVITFAFAFHYWQQSNYSTALWLALISWVVLGCGVVFAIRYYVLEPSQSKASAESTSQVEPRTPPELHGLLIPANEPTPSHDCDDMPAQAVLFLAGKTGSGLRSQ